MSDKLREREKTLAQLTEAHKAEVGEMDAVHSEMAIMAENLRKQQSEIARLSAALAQAQSQSPGNTKPPLPRMKSVRFSVFVCCCLCLGDRNRSSC